MEFEDVTFKPIGVVHSQYRQAKDTPVQPLFAQGSPGRIEVFAPYAEGLSDIEGFSHLHLLYWLHKAGPAALRVVPFLDDKPHGIFATRSPNRPNPIGLSIVRLRERRGALLFIEDVDILDGTPLLDIKPYFVRCDAREGARSGWTDTIDEEVQSRRGACGGVACPSVDHEPLALDRSRR